MLKGLSEEEKSNLICPTTLFLAYRGSIAHGMYVPNTDTNSVDDKDIIGMCVGPIESYLGLKTFEQKEVFYKEWDLVNYSVRKLFKLLIHNNPNVLSMLFLEPKHYIITSCYSDYLINNRELFISKKAYHSFTGYAYSQLKKMTALECLGYMGDKRKKLVEKYGYDTKNAAHLIRLLTMSIEYLNEGVLYVDRGLKGDAPYLLSIKHGEMSLEQVKKEADRLFKRAEDVYDRCKLPHAPQYEKIERLCVDILKSYFKTNG